MKALVRILFVSIFVALSYGLYHKSQVDFTSGNRIIGFTVLVGAFVFLPLFLYHRWNGKQLKDYTLSNENLKKMKESMNRTPPRKK
jgi:hypothetical protein